MPKLTGLAEKIIVFFKKEQLFAWLQIIRFDPEAANSILLFLKGKLLQGTNQVVPITELINNFIVTYNHHLSDSTREMLDDLLKVSQQTNFDKPQLSKKQTQAIDLLLDPKFLEVSSYLLNPNSQLALMDEKLYKKYDSFMTTVLSIAENDQLTPIEQGKFLNDLSLLSLELTNIFYSLELRFNDSADCDYKAFGKYVSLLPLKFYQPGIFNRIGALCLALLIAIIGNFILLNPIVTILGAIAYRNPTLLLLVLEYPFLPLLNIVYTVPKLTKLGWQPTVLQTKFAVNILADRYLVLSLLLISLAIGSALAVVFVPPLVPFIVSLPYLSVLAGLSIPLLATLTGLLVAMLATVFAALTTALLTKVSLPTTGDSSFNLHAQSNISLVEQPELQQLPKNDAIGKFTEVLSKEIPVQVEHSVMTKTTVSRKSYLYKQEYMDDFGGLALYYRRDGKFDILLKKQDSRSTTHTLKIGNQLIVIRDGIIENKLPDHVILRVAAPVAKCVA